MKLTLEKFDFTKLTPESVLSIEVSKGSMADMQTAEKTLVALKRSGKIPKETLCLLFSKNHPVSFKEIPKAMMNDHGWFRK